MQNPNAYQFPQLFNPADFQASYQFPGFSLNFSQHFPQMSSVMYNSLNYEANVKKEASPKSINSLEAMTESPSVIYDMMSTSPSLTSTTEETFYGAAQE